MKLTIKKIFILSLTIMLFSLAACSNGGKSNPSQGLTMAVLWQQKSAEAKALFYQAFNIAKLRVEQTMKTFKGPKKAAVVVDIDETVLDNSPYEAKLVLKGKSFNSKSWKKWCMLSKAKAVPGAVAFLKFAVSKGADVFYVSNRKKITQSATMKNMKALGFPQVKANHFLLKTTTSKKKARRETIMKTHKIILLCGDNLGDFSELYDKKPSADRVALVHKMKAEFGTKFIVLPNPMYGAWDFSTYNYKYSKSAKEKDSSRKAALESY